MASLPSDARALSLDVAVGPEIVRLVGEEMGHGKTVLLLHGWAHSRSIWQDVVPLLHDRCRVLSVDLPGFGGSTSPKRELVEIRGYARMLDLALGSIDNVSPIQAIAADSLSARLLLEVLRANKRWSSVNILFSGCPFDGLPTFAKNIGALGLPAMAFWLARRSPRALAAPIIRKLAGITVERSNVDLDPIVSGVLQSDPTVAGRLFNDLAQPVVAPNHFVHQGLFVIARGSNDRVVSHRTTKKWAALLHGAMLEFDDSGHTPMLEASSAYAKAVLGLL